MLFMALVMAGPVRGQAPGYMGKKWLITADASFMMAFFNQNHSMKQGLKDYAMNIRGVVDLDHVVSRRVSLGATFDIHATGLAFDWNSDRYPQKLVPGLSNNYKNCRIQGFGYGLNVKIFADANKGGIAPLGWYTKIDALLIDARAMPYAVAERKVYESYSQQILAPIIGITAGQQRILWNHLVLRSAVQFAIVPTGIGPYMRSIDSVIAETDQDEQLRTLALRRLFAYYLFNVNVGVGFLIPYRQKVK